MKFIIIGCGRVGAGLVRSLNQRGHTVVLVDSDPAVRSSLGAGDHQHLIIGSALDRETLLKLGEVFHCWRRLTSMGESSAAVAIGAAPQTNSAVANAVEKQ
jgi:nucleoside-diphosphate-sugar epimerase